MLLLFLNKQIKFCCSAAVLVDEAINVVVL